MSFMILRHLLDQAADVLVLELRLLEGTLGELVAELPVVGPGDPAQLRAQRLHLFGSCNCR